MVEIAHNIGAQLPASITNSEVMGVKMNAVGVFLISMFFLYLPLILIAPASFAAEGRMLVFGRIQDDPVRAIRDRQEFVDYLGRKLAPVGISGGKIFVVDNIHLLAQALKENKVDLFHDTAVPTMVLARRAGAVPILRQWKYGEAEYESVIIARKNSGIDVLANLVGKVLAFDEPHSTSAHILPRMLLAEKNLNLIRLNSPGEGKPNAIGYVFGADGSATNLLLTGRVDAAATSLREFEELRPDVRDTLKVLGKSKSAPRLLIAIRKDLDQNLHKSIRDVLINMDKDPEGLAVLKRQQKTTRIDEIPAASLQQLKSIEKFVYSLPENVDAW
jgi:phosphonate transport system substrate-binding protein